MVEGLGLKLGDLVMMSENSQGYLPKAQPQFARMKAVMADASGTESASIEQGSQEVEVSLSATFSVK
jgi:uncharacterized protein YggE